MNRTCSMHGVQQRSFGRSKCRLKDNIKMNFRKTGCKYLKQTKLSGWDLGFCDKGDEILSSVTQDHYNLYNLFIPYCPPNINHSFVKLTMVLS
jgi:hypothetical protein